MKKSNPSQKWNSTSQNLTYQTWTKILNWVERLTTKLTSRVQESVREELSQQTI